MQITAYSYEGDKGTEFYCYLKSNAGKIGEAIGNGFIRSFLKALAKIWKRR